MCEISADELGPLKFIHIRSKKAALRAVVAIDNIALGPAIGGVRVSPAVTAGEVQRLARTMTLKNSIAGLAHGGGKAGIMADPKSPEKEHHFRIFARLIKELVEYIPGPDMGSDEVCMAWIYDETGRASGLPEEIGGLPLDKLGATGFGLAECAEAAAPFAGVELRGARVSIQGFGSVGKAAARFLAKKGAVLVAASDSKGGIHNPDGMDIEELIKIKEEGSSVADYKKAKKIPGDEIFTLDTDILIPAATPDVIILENAGSIKAKIILQGANIAVTREAEKILHEKGVLSVPDFIANAGGVIMAAMEYEKRSERDAFLAISDKIRKNTLLILEKSRKEKILPRTAAEGIALARLYQAQKYRDF
jgi:glutamate dehydrogenase (NAD(P)+)